jgi:hypothetical protein
MPARSIAAGLLALAQLFGCATSKPGGERFVLAGSAAQNVLVLPLNVATLMPPELVSLGPIVWEELETYLQAPGRRLTTVSHEVARRFWLSSIRQVRAGQNGAQPGFDDAARVLVARLAQHVEFDTVIAASLSVRPALVEGPVASWDGVERPVEVEAYGNARGLAHGGEMKGSAAAASLHAVVWDASGEKLQEGIGGIELLVRVHVTRKRSTGEVFYQYLTRPDPFSNRAHLRQALELALSPLLPPPLAETE